jgi:hypothetical protein
MASRWNSCNVFQTGADSRRLWQFESRKGELHLSQERVLRADEPLPATVVGKTWNSIWQPKLNVACLPAESIFLRVVHLPKSSIEETVSMVELQLEKLSPIPVTQLVWSLQPLPSQAEDLQTVVVTFVERKAVETFLGQLEGQGYLADRLEFPALDELMATPIAEDGAWVYPGAWGSEKSAMVAWCYGGTLQHIDIITLPSDGDAAASLREQISQTIWAGELDGWLMGPPAWHLVADEALAATWEAPLRQGLDAPIAFSPPLPPAELATLTAKRSVQPDTKTNLLPSEFSKRYQQQYVDRLWIHGLAAVGIVYVACVLVYFAVVGVTALQTTSVEKKVKALSNTYTNAIQLKARYEVLLERQELKFAALDCWKAVAETLPETVTLDAMNFNDGKRLTLNCTAPRDDASRVLDFSSELRKSSIAGKPLFSAEGSDPPTSQATPNSATVNWRFGLDLQRTLDQ